MSNNDYRGQIPNLISFEFSSRDAEEFPLNESLTIMSMGKLSSRQVNIAWLHEQDSFSHVVRDIHQFQEAWRSSPLDCV